MNSRVRFAIMLMCMFLAVACHNATPPGFDGNRPTLGLTDGESGQPSEWLADSDPRYEGPDFSLRYSAGGVMITRDAGGTIGFMDIDNGASAEFDPNAGILTVNGREISAEADTVATDGSAIWLRLTDAEGNIHMIVTEP